MRFSEDLPLRVNVEIDLFERGKRRVWHQATHNIITNVGREFVIENITPLALGPGSFTRTQNTVVRYVGFGIGGTRQTDSSAGVAPLGSAYPAGYAGSNLQTDDDVTVSRLERPVQLSSGVWLREITTPGTFGSIYTTFVANFTELDINFGGFTSVPLSEIALYKSSADPNLPNGGAGAYPGPTGQVIAYDTFNAVPKTGIVSIQARWSWRVG